MKQLAIILLALIFCAKTYAWGDLGHEVTADIAEQILANDVQTKRAIQAIIGVEPFATAAIWPDKVRSDERFDDFAFYHYITIFRDSKKISEKNALTVLQKYPNILTDAKAPREAKMLALRYIVHVMGDIHQPLHVGNEFDRGGNFCQVKWQPTSERAAEKANLHAVWDTDLVNYIANKFKSEGKESSKYYGYKQVATSLIAKYKDLIASTPTSVDLDKWVSESGALRETSVYPDQIAEDQRPYCLSDSKKIKPEDIPTLDHAYAERSGALVERRLVLGGVHLANFLKKVFKDSNLNSPVEADILQMLKLAND